MELSWASFARLLLLLLVYFRFSFFDVVFYLLSVPLGVDFELASRPSDPQKPRFSLGNLNICEKNYDLDPKMVLKACWGSLGLLLGALGGPLGALGALYIDHRGLPD